MTEDGGPRSGRTAVEDAFLTALLDGRPWLDVWLHEDDDGTPWVCVSHDFSEHGSIRDTLRLDFDGSEVLGGWSPASLNWDDGVRATAAAIDVDGPDGLRRTGPVEQLADAAGAWFDGHRVARRAAR
jgi:hypothetical protein